MRVDCEYCGNEIRGSAYIMIKLFHHDKVVCEACKEILIKQGWRIFTHDQFYR